MDFKQICRICLETCKQSFDIFTSYYLKRSTLYSDMLSNCTKLKPFNEDGLPRLICKECSKQLKRAYSFNIQCEESDKKLRKYLENSAAKSADIEEKLDIDSVFKSQDNSDAQNGGNLIDFVFSDKNQDEMKNIKLEPNENCVSDEWDAEDNAVLQEIKSGRVSTEPNFNDYCNEYDAQDLEEIKSRRPSSESENGLVDSKDKKRRARQKQTPSVPGSKLPHQCDVCGKLLSTRSNLKAHKISHTDLRPFKCTECNATFRGHSALFQHKRVHTGETPYQCKYCSKQFSRRTALVNHIRIHTGEKLFSCEICFKTFVQNAQLSIHMKRHKGDKSYLCQDCGKGFPVKSDLQVHMRIHNGEKPYSCHLCTKTFTTSGNLSIHVRIHNKEIRYHCKECLRGFVTNSAYNVHLKRHKGQRDYQCECGKTFYTSSALKQHKIVHTGEKKYQCKICDKKFSQTSHLTRHFKRDHAKPNAPVPSSEYYKRIVDAKPPPHIFEDSGVKCEGT